MEQGQRCAYNQTTDRVLGANLLTCDFSDTTIEDWIPILEANSGVGVWMTHAQQTPSTGLRAPIDLVYLDKKCRVVEVVEVHSARPITPTNPRAASVLALPTQSIQSSQTQPGDQLMLCAAEEILWRLKRFSSANEVASAAPCAIQEPIDLAQAPLSSFSSELHPNGRPYMREARDFSMVKRPVSNETSKYALLESKPKKVEAPMSWWRRLVFPGSTLQDHAERRRALRKSAPGLAAHFWTGGPPQAHIIRDISTTGLYVVNKERWYPGTLVRMALTMADTVEQCGVRSIIVQAQAIRWGNDGVGLQFVLQSPKKARQQQSSRFDGTDSMQLDQFLKRLWAEGR